MYYIVVVISILCTLAMFKVNRQTKGAILITGTIVFTLVKIPVIPIHLANNMLCLCFLLSEIRYIHQYMLKQKKTPVTQLLKISIIAAFFCIITSPHIYNTPQTIRLFIQSELFFKYFAICYTFWAFSDEKSITTTIKYTTIAMVVLTILGILNFLTKSATFVNAATAGQISEMTGGLSYGDLYTYRDRFRVQSMFRNPFDYGYICVMMLLFHIHCFIKRQAQLPPFIIVCICCLFGIFTCGCRTIIFCAIITFGCYMLLAFKPKKYVKYGLITSLILIGAYLTIPYVQEQGNKMLTIFDDKSDVSGSSLEMRMIQYAAVFYHISDHEIFGRGYAYFTQDLGWGKGAEYLVDKDLYGLEGVTMNLLLERGFLGLICWAIFYIILINYFWKQRKSNKQVAALGLSITILYLCFANMTGELLSVYPTLLLLGYVISVIEEEKHITKQL